MINDILDFSKIEAGKLEIEASTFDLRDSSKTSHGCCAAAGARKGPRAVLHTSNRRCPTSVRGDPARLRQVLVNLSAMPIKFTDQGEVSLIRRQSRVERRSSKLLFAVRDTGIGIPADRVDTLFEAVHRRPTSSTTRRFGGTGLGLSISKRLAEAMGGTIEVDSVPGQGSTFRFEILLRQCDVPLTSEVANQLAGLRVQLVVRHPSDRRILDRQLIPEGCSLTFASTAQQGLCSVQCDAGRRQSPLPAAVVVDYELADHSGPWLAAAIRESGAPPSSFILLTSLSASVPDADTRLIDRVVTKPARPRYWCAPWRNSRRPAGRALKAPTSLRPHSRFPACAYCSRKTIR